MSVMWSMLAAVLCAAFAGLSLSGGNYSGGAVCVVCVIINLIVIAKEK